MALDQSTFAQIEQAPDLPTLARIYDFTFTGDQDESNQRARALLDARIRELTARQGMQLQAKNYRRDIGTHKEDIYNPMEDEARRGLAESMAKNDAADNRRGLLYSGQHQSNQLKAGAGYANETAKAQAAANETAENTASGMEQQSIGSGVAATQNTSQAANEAYKQALQQRQSRNEMIGSGLGAIGGVVGRGIASKKYGSQA